MIVDGEGACSASIERARARNARLQRFNKLMLRDRCHQIRDMSRRQHEGRVVQQHSALQEMRACSLYSLIGAHGVTAMFRRVPEIRSADNVHPPFRFPFSLFLLRLNPTSLFFSPSLSPRTLDFTPPPCLLILSPRPRPSSSLFRCPDHGENAATVEELTSSLRYLQRAPVSGLQDCETARRGLSCKAAGLSAVPRSPQ